MEVVDAVVAWIRTNPALAAGGLLALLVVFGYLRRPDPVLAQGAKEAARLAEKNRGKYDDLRSLE